jgi:hypothetical protein
MAIFTRKGRLNSQLIISLACGSLVRRSNALVFVISSASPDGCLRISCSCLAYNPSGITCHAYKVSSSGVVKLKGVIWLSVDPSEVAVEYRAVLLTCKPPFLGLVEVFKVRCMQLVHIQGAAMQLSEMTNTQGEERRLTASGYTDL